MRTYIKPSLFPSFSLHDVLCDPSDLVWRKGTAFEAMIGRIAPSWQSASWGFLGFSSAERQMPPDLCKTPRIISLSPLSLVTDVTDTTLGASGLWLGTRTGASGTATLTEKFFWPQPMVPLSTGLWVTWISLQKHVACKGIMFIYEVQL